MRDREVRGPLTILAEYDSSSSPGKKHQVRIGGDGVLYCSCHAGIKALRGGRECWHMTDWKGTHPNWRQFVPRVMP